MNPQTEKLKKKSKGHKCYLCGHRFETVHILRKHVNIHKDKDLECELCGKFFSSSWGLKKHFKIHSNERPYKCIYCEKGFRQKYTLRGHIEKIHENYNAYTYCQTCGKRLRPDTSKVQCWLCSYEGKQLTSTVVSTFESSNAVQTITDNVSDELSSMQDPTDVALNANNDDSGEICVEKFYNESHVDSNPKQTSFIIVKKFALDCKSAVETSLDDKSMHHSKLVIQENPNVETVLDTVVETKANNYNDGKQEATCMQCAVTFPSLIALRQHTAEVHKPNWNFSCHLCNEKFATPEAQRNHVMKHKEIRPFTCMVCSHSFKSQISLKSHLQTHRPDRPFSCKHCNFSFKTLLALKSHAIVHQQERPFVCRECGFAFKLLDHLKRHMIVHTGEMPYKCDECGKLFRYPGNLGRHYYLHSKKRLFVCNICGKDFAQAGGLKQHEQVHNKNFNADKNLICPLCGKAYKLLRQLRKHVITHR